MVHLQSKNHLLSWLEKNCTRQAIKRALQEGNVELYGGFDSIPPTTQPGWIVKVTSLSNKSWYIAILTYRDRYGIRIIKRVPWKNWIGDITTSLLHQGDNPKRYGRSKNARNINA